MQLVAAATSIFVIADVTVCNVASFTYLLSLNVAILCAETGAGLQLHFQIVARLWIFIFTNITVARASVVSLHVGQLSATLAGPGWLELQEAPGESVGSRSGVAVPLGARALDPQNSKFSLIYQFRMD